MLAAGVSMKTVQETLGHSSLVLTANTYTSVYPEVATAAAEAAAAHRAPHASDSRRRVGDAQHVLGSTDEMREGDDKGANAQTPSGRPILGRRRRN